MQRLKGIVVSLALLLIGGADPARADDWQALVDELGKEGIAPHLLYDGDGAANLSGGNRRGVTASNNLHVQVNLDGERLVGVPGLTVHLDGLWISGGAPSRLVGDAQGVSNIQAPSAVRMYEAWVQYNFPGDTWSILAGRFDLSTEFYRLASAGLFLNNSFGIGPEFGLSGVAGPSVFPNTSLGLRVAYKPTADTVVRAAVLDGAPLDQQDGSPNPFNPHDGVLLVGEAAWLTRSALSRSSSEGLRIGRNATRLDYDDKVAVGVWYYTASFRDLSFPPQALNPGQRQGEWGGYLLVDRLLFRSASNPQRRITGFLQLGIADPVVDRFSTYVGAGLVMAGWLPDRPSDKLGLAVAMARNSPDYITGQQLAGVPQDDAETAIELDYLLPVTSRVTLQPDIQYVIHPNTDARLHNATVVQLGCAISF
ncbi:MAG TPA: carbohydrate porin [Rhodopila sp.]|nr:carbohydrate porin [Rhodopila sp.]